MAEWYESHDNLAEMARRMADSGATTDNLISFVERPWKWTREWEQRDQHDTARCTGILDCDEWTCEECFTVTLACLVRPVDVGEETFDLCPKCREARHAA